MKNILCYGDSNTWGADPAWSRQGVPQRHGPDVRWTGVLQKELGSDYRIYECGLNSRNSAFEDTLVPDCNGLKTLPMVLNMVRPLDLVILMLGTNDCKHRLGLGPGDIARAMEALITCVRKADCGNEMGKPPKIILVCPVPLSDDVKNFEWGGIFTPDSCELSRQLAPYYRAVAERTDCIFVDAGEVAQVSPGDCVHLDGENHRLLAERLLPVIRSALD